MTVNVLGTEYSIGILTSADDKYLDSVDGYCDKTSKRIVVKAWNKEPEIWAIDDYNVYLKTLLRHEIVHAFLFESGLHENFKHDTWGHDETMVDWIATQGLKIYKAWESVGAV